MDSPSLLSRESTTLSFTNPQNGHFMVRKRRFIVNDSQTWHRVPSPLRGALSLRPVSILEHRREPRICKHTAIFAGVSPPTGLAFALWLTQGFRPGLPSAAPTALA